VAAGVALAIALSIFFSQVGLALNLGLIDSESNVKTIGLVNALAWVIGGLVAVFAGAWVAGRMSTARTAVGGGVHGLAVWATAAIVTVLLAVSAAGMIGTGMVQLAGKGLETVGSAASIVAPNWDTVKEELKEAKVALTDKDTSANPEGANKGDENRFVESSRLIELAGRHFALDGTTLPAGEREELVKLVAARLEISPEAAERTLGQWTNVWETNVQRFETAKAEVIEIADEARAFASAAAGWAALAMLLGAVAAAIGGAYGTACALRCSTLHWHSDDTHVATGAPMVREGVAPPPSINPSMNPSSKPAGKTSTPLR